MRQIPAALIPGCGVALNSYSRGAHYRPLWRRQIPAAAASPNPSHDGMKQPRRLPITAAAGPAHGVDAQETMSAAPLTMLAMPDPPDGAIALF
jgi:hypothetical protein